MLSWTKKMKILIVDDEPDSLKVLKDIIEKKGYTTLAFQSPVQALNKIKTEEVDLILTDLKMPEMDGIQFLYQVKANHPLIPIIVLTGYASIDSAVKAVQWGAFDYLRKPCEVTRIYDVLERAGEFIKKLRTSQ